MIQNLQNIPISQSYQQVVQTTNVGSYNLLGDGSGSAVNKIGVSGSDSFFIANNNGNSIIYASSQIQPQGTGTKTIGTPLNPFNLVYADTAVNVGNNTTSGKIIVYEAGASNPIEIQANTDKGTKELRLEVSGPIKSLFTKDDTEGNKLVLTKERAVGIPAQVGDYSGIIDLTIASSSFGKLDEVSGSTARISSKITGITSRGVRGSIVFEGSEVGNEDSLKEIVKIGQDEVPNVSGFGVDMTASLMVGDSVPFIYLQDQFNKYPLAQLSKATNLPSNDEGTLRLFKTGNEIIRITAGGESFISGGLAISGGLSIDGLDFSASLANITASSFPYTGSAGISGSLEVNGTISATNYIGTGSDLYGVQKEIHIGTTPPSNPTIGDLWFDSQNITTLIRYNDGDSEQWVEIVGDNGLNELSKVYFGDGSLTAPTITFTSEPTIGMFRSGSGVAFVESGSNAVMRYDNNVVYINNLNLEGIGDVKTAISSSGNANGWQKIKETPLATGTTILYSYDPNNVGGAVMHYRVCDDNNAIGRTGTLHLVNTSNGSALNYSDAGSSDIGDTTGINVYAEYNLGLDLIEIKIDTPTNLFAITAKALYL